MTGIIGNILSLLGLAKSEPTPVDACPPDLVQAYCNCSQTYQVMFWTLFGLVVLYFLYIKSKRILKKFMDLKIGKEEDK